ncbi:MAG: DUF2007 domain-containing protein [Desulfobacterales bacterium]|nr:DUF2007 domain-containing protein [Desulfobacterales bacterium]
MFCPKCRSEYVPGIKVCPECRKRLVAKLPRVKKPLPQKMGRAGFAELMITFNPSDIALIKSILDSAGIRYHFKNENFVSVNPLIQPATLMVGCGQVIVARKLLKSLKIKFWAMPGLGKKLSS